MLNEDQASKLRRLVRQARQTWTIAVTSGKGGVGKSNIALNLSILLSAAGHRVALVDADLGLADLDVLLGIEARGDLSHVIARTRRLEQIVVDLPNGVQFVPGASGLAKLADLSEFQRAALLRELSGLEADNDMIVVDTAAGIGINSMHFAGSADSVLVVTVPEPTAISDAYAVIKLLLRRRFEGQLSLLVNMADGRRQARETYQRVTDVAMRFLGARVLDAGYLPLDPRVREAVRARQPFVLMDPRCPASRSLASLAVNLRPGGPLVRRKEGFFRRVVNWFA